jgi:alkanesulfonate monooxygenase SsuD/methylene tetrahydromethanopterin reductase-like flavin-dependent oxidoreductase (luciferase family)
VKFSYVMLPDYSLEESLASIKLADQLGFHGCYAADETWHKDLWLLFAAAAAQTDNIRFGPSLSSVVLREPSLIAQAAATLDELTGGRAEVVLSCGNFGLLAQYTIDWAQTRPLSRVRRLITSCAPSSTRGRSPSTASSSSTTGCSRSPGRSRSACRC